MDVKDYICIVIGIGIGGALVLDKKIRHGKNFFAGEFGYMMMEDSLLIHLCRFMVRVRYKQ